MTSIFTRLKSLSSQLKSSYLKAIFGIAFIAFSFNSYSQIVMSIGTQSDGMEGGSDVSYIIYIENGLVNNTGSAITGYISYLGTATNGVDFVAVSSFSIPNGASSTIIVLPVIDDALVECDESVIALIEAPSAGTIGNATSSAIIVDNECASLIISIGSPVDGMEGGANVSFTVFIENGATNNTGGDIFGTISFAGTAGFSDVSIPTTTYSIPNGASSTIIVLSVIDDSLVECDETIIAAISSPNIGNLGNASSTAIIVDDECGSVIISIGSPVDGTEGASDISYTVFLENGAVNGTGAAIIGSVNYAGTASAGSDYVNLSTFSIPNGASSTIMTVSIIDDSLIECDETIIATISNPTIGSIGNATSTATIIDDECTMGFDDVNSSEVAIRLYPNPVNSTLTFLSEQEMESYSIIDLNGRLVSNGEIHSKEFNLTTVFLSEGAYIVSVYFTDGRIATKRILKD